MSFLSKIFGSKGNNVTADLNLLGVDMHSHLIPGIDDGAATLEDATELIRQMKSLGYRKLIITPHIKDDSYRNNPAIIKDNLEILKKHLSENNVEIELDIAAEYFMDYEFGEKFSKEKILTFGRNYVLIELSYFNPPPNLDTLIFDLQTNGYRPILAHVERYPYWHFDFKTYQKYKDRGVYFQLNIISLSGYYSMGVKKVAEKLIEKGMIEFLGTDMHNQTYLDSLKRSLHSKHLIQLLDSNKLLNNKL
ncbi:MAG: CpsB/CapC family capsule biosynthesis tyrosine phosphatase [Bacteroidota bacterium]|nr:CpsB/CapC family capsule biosynthesis tyrosine phosphatase [Bacteroidota bacterium]